MSFATFAWGQPTPSSSSGASQQQSYNGGKGRPFKRPGSGGGSGGGRGGGGGGGAGPASGGYRPSKAPRQAHFDGVSFSLHSTDKVAVSCKYSERLNGVWRRHNGFFHKDDKMWLLPLSSYKAVLEDLRGDEVQELPSFVTRHIDAAGVFSPPTPPTSSAEARRAWESTLPTRLRESLLPFQRDGVTAAVRRGGRVLIGDEMGLGKTLQALSVAYHYSDDWPLLIICPSSLRHTWAGEIAKWLEIDESSIQIISTGKQKPDNLICIISYDLAAKMPDQLRRFNIIIADEAHYLKNPDAKRTKAIAPLARAATRTLLLTGTPALSRPIEMYTLLNILEPTVFASMVQFGMRYAAGFQGPFGWDFTGASNLSELHVVASTVLIRRLKKDVLSQLPAKSRQQVFVEIALKSLKEIGELQKRRVALDGKIRSASGATEIALKNERRALTIKMYGMTGLSKVTGALAYLDELLERDIKVLVFAHHLEVLDAVSAHLSRKAVRHIRIDGNTPQQLRQEMCTRFQEDAATKAAVLSITAAGVGLTLHAAATVVFFELYWNPGSLLQAEDRAHRLGQQKSVDVKYVVARGTLDDAQWQLLQRKITVVGQCVTGTTTGDLDVDMDEEDAAAAAAAEAEQLASQGQPFLKEFLESNGVRDTIAAAPAALPRTPLAVVVKPQVATLVPSPSCAVDRTAAQGVVDAQPGALLSGGAVTSRPCAICGSAFPPHELAAHVVACAEQFAVDAFSKNDDDDDDDDE